MIARLLDWADDRTGYRQLAGDLLNEPVPGGARWRYVWGSTLVFTFFIQMVTGFCLWTAYSPSVQHAWESVFHIQHVMTAGWLIRGLHHYAAQAMVVLLAIHLMQVVIDGAYRAPREFNFWIGLILMQIVLGLALTGYLLPWDQKGYYATQVATKIAGATPLIGPQIQQLAQGGPAYGHLTLTRFFALHAGLLPASLVGFLGLHIYVFRRHGITAKDPSRADGQFWPDQVLKDGVACLGVLAILLLLVIFRGAHLSSPADPASPFSAARPEWYFLFLFRFLKFEAVEHFGLAFGAIYVPGAIMAVIGLMPLIGWWKLGHKFNVAFMWFLALGIGGLTGLAMWEDANDPTHQAALQEAERDAARIVELASTPNRIPVEGAVTLLRTDPLTQGPRIFAQHCASCHHYNGHDGRGRIVMDRDPETGNPMAAKATAPDLGNLGSPAWMRSILVDFDGHLAALRNAFWYGDEDTIDLDGSEMTDWSGDREALAAEENKENLAAIVAFMVAESGRVKHGFSEETIAAGRSVAEDGLLGASCTDCHESFGEAFDPDAEGGSGYPDINGYLSKEWLSDFIRDPGQEQFYGAKNRMPAFADKLSAEELELLVDWLTTDDGSFEEVR
jgi:ubiquinol-cytochrome c reductase cytochrome b subunit